MNTGIAVLIAVVLVGAGVIAFVASQSTAPVLSEPNEPDTVEVSPSNSGEGFGIGNVHQVKPPEVRVRITDSHLEIPPAEWVIEIYNGADTPTTFELRYQRPGEPWLGYDSPPVGVGTWLEYPKTVTVNPKSIGRARVVLTVPGGEEDLYDTNWCFWVVVSEISAGNIVSEVTVWWLIEMR